MSPSQYQRAVAVFQAALDRPEVERGAWLVEACAGDAALRAQVDAMLREDAREAGLMAEDRLGVGTALILDGNVTTAAGLAAAHDVLPERIGPYRVLRKVGEGGMGVVFEAQQETPRRIVALKVMRQAFGHAGLLRRFQHEIDLLGRLQHPGIARIYDAAATSSPTGNVPYFAMEFVQGRPLTAYADAHDLDVRERIELAAAVCDIVQYAHQKGVIHRDLKPGNILVSDEGTPKILDFGIGRLIAPDGGTTMHTEAGQIIGTVPYMSPEQIAGDSLHIDTRSDVYSLGVVIYELLSGKLPHEISGAPLHTAARIVSEQAPRPLGTRNPALRGDIETIVSKALAREPQRRYPSAGQLADDLRRYLRNEPIFARAPTAMYQIRMFARRNRGKVAVALAILLMLVGWGITQSVSAARERTLRSEATANAESARRYANRMLLATADAVMTQHPAKALAHLESMAPEARGWEWRYLWSKLHWCQRMLSSDAGTPTAVGFSPDGQPRAAVTRAGVVEWLDVESGDVLRTFRAATALQVLAISADAQRMAIWEPESGHLQVVGLTDGRTEFEQALIPKAALLVALNANGSVLAVCQELFGISVIDLRTRQTRVHKTHPGGEFTGFALSPDGSRLALGDHLAAQGYWIRVINTITGEEFEECYPIGTLHRSFAFSPDGAILAVGAQQRVVPVQVESGDELGSLQSETTYVIQVAYSGDGTHLASAESDGSIRVTDLSSGQVDRIQCDLNYPRNGSIAVGPAGRVVLAAGVGEARMWDLRDENPRVLRDHASYVYNTAFSADGRWLATSAWDQTVRVWDAARGTLERRLTIGELRAFAFALGFEPREPRVRVTLPWEEETLVYDLDRDRWLDRVKPSPSELVHPAPAEPGRLTTQDVCRVLRTLRGGSKAVLHYGGEYAATSWDGAWLAEGLSNGDVAVKDVQTGREVRRFRIHDQPVLAVAFSADGARIATGDKTGLVRISDALTGARLADLQGHTRAVYTVNFSPDGKRLASGGDDNIVILWDAERYDQVFELAGHTAYVHSVCFSPDGTQLLSGSGDFTARVWDTLSPADRLRQNGRAGQEPASGN